MRNSHGRSIEDCSKVWQKFRPRTSCDTSSVIQARRYLSYCERKIKPLLHVGRCDEASELQERQMNIQEQYRNAKSLAFVTRADEVLKTSLYCKGMTPDDSEVYVGVCNEVEVCLMLGDTLQLIATKSQEWHVERIDLIDGIVTLKSMVESSMPPINPLIGKIRKSTDRYTRLDVHIQSLGGAWVYHKLRGFPGSQQMFQIPSTNSEWGQDYLEDIAKHHSALGTKQTNNSIQNINRESHTEVTVCQNQKQQLRYTQLGAYEINTTEMVLGWPGNPDDKSRDEWMLELEDGSGSALSSHYNIVYRGEYHACALQNLNPNTRYRFRLSKVGADGKSGSNHILQVATLPVAPGILNLEGFVQAPNIAMVKLGISGRPHVREDTPSTKKKKRNGISKRRPKNKKNDTTTDTKCRFVIEMCPLSKSSSARQLYEAESDDRVGWQRVYKGRSTPATIGGLEPGSLYCFRSCWLNVDGRQGEWGPASVVRVPKSTDANIKKTKRSKQCKSRNGKSKRSEVKHDDSTLENTSAQECEENRSPEAAVQPLNEFMGQEDDEKGYQNSNTVSGERVLTVSRNSWGENQDTACSGNDQSVTTISPEVTRNVRKNLAAEADHMLQVFKTQLNDQVCIAVQNYIETQQHHASVRASIATRVLELGFRESSSECKKEIR